MTATDEQHGQLDTGYPHTLRPDANDGEDGEFDGPNYCPNCGRKVES